MNRFCSECGHKLDADQVFCPECGTQQQTAKVEPQQVPVQPKAPVPQQAPKPARKPLTLKKKVGVTLVVLLAAGGVAGHQIIKANTEPQQKVDAFLQGLYEGDMDSAMGEIIVPKDTVSDLTAFQEYLVEQDLTEFKSRFYEAGSGVVEDGITRVVLHENGTELFKVKESKFIGMYPGIEIEAIPMNVELASDVEGMEFILGDESVATVNGELPLGQYLPGVYDCSLSMKNGEVEKIVESECGITEGDEVLLDFNLKDMGVEIWSNDEEAIVYINEKSTGKTVKDLPFVGPVDAEETIKLFAERKTEKGDVEQSEVIEAAAGSFVQLPIYSAVAEDEEKEKAEEKEDEKESEEAAEEEVAEEETAESVNEEQLQTFIADFRSAYEISLNAKDFSVVDEYLKEGSVARKELVDFIGNIGDDYYMYEFWIDEAVGVEILEDKAFVTTYEEFDFTNHLGEVTNYKRSKKYEVQGTDSGDLKISRIDIIDTTRD
ncbi:TcaA NTF2-like domain-containing protein [Planococcus alpniumensis]|uniref:TcaA NTF2-like domain-containing protein n=1 Tax=Planococcus alpniumensis TaxID=2708345 RepID=UPI001B8BDC53|nr:zinc ribbon domain-containing protein [Planococcus sp. MSAK28401]